VQDALALQSMLTDKTLCAYPQSHIRFLHDATATQQNILAELAWLKQCCIEDGEATVVVYFSGHGWREKSTGDYYLIPHETQPYNEANTALPAAVFSAALRQIQAKRLLVFVDSCHAEGMAAAKETDTMLLPPNFSKTALPNELVAELKQGGGRAVFTSSRGEEKSWVRKDGKLSIYTHHLLEALDGAGSTAGDTTVRVSHLMNHLAKTVPVSVGQQWSAVQTPFFDMAAEDFPVAVLRGGKGLTPGGWQGPSPQTAALQGAQYHTELHGDGLIVQGTGIQVATSGSAIIGGDVSGDVILGNKKD
jgi:uncharacterized caspase-like protein